MKMNQNSIVVAVQNSAHSKPVSKLLLYLMLLLSATYVAYTLRLISATSSDPSRASASACFHRHHEDRHLALPTRRRVADRRPQTVRRETGGETEIGHVVFGIAASAKLWRRRKEYIKLWFRRESMRGIVWLDEIGKDYDSESESESGDLPPVRISGDTSRFPYTNKRGHRSAIRISRIVAETARLGLAGDGEVRWFVMGDDDTVFVAENLVRVLRKYDHNQMYYIGSSSESHVQNIFFSYAMAYGGGGFAISRPLAVALASMQDRCIRRYPGLYGSDERVQACVAELGVPLTREVGFHQFDVYGNLFGLLAAHPVAPFVSMHHLDVVEPIFPDQTRVEALKRLAAPVKLDSAAIMQQSICYHRSKTWTVSVSWGYAVQIFRGVISAREMEMPTRTFLNWYRREDYKAYSFNTRPVARNPCQKPFVFYFSDAKLDRSSNTSITKYIRHHVTQPKCTWKMDNPSRFEVVKVFKKPDANLWNRSPRRNCCRIMDSEKNGTMVIDVGLCKDGEVTEL